MLNEKGNQVSKMMWVVAKIFDFNLVMAASNMHSKKTILCHCFKIWPELFILLLLFASLVGDFNLVLC